ncbi:uroporphyrinogen-III C-methyltransferase [Gallaecimonas mangrovi]|uniref:uroporphyrinogen-III C-methyltransferase n=1 Tax=Gallaecimonas mangrovi TaxID=2291597 RepID=UPI000E20A570|nr:uroporphyrinogen-III C-methyltransferase [Gallaecimonas mangrovi]
MTVLIIRPDPQASRLAATLDYHKVPYLVSPLLTITPEPVPADLTDKLAKAQWVIAVSAHAVAGLAKPLPSGPRFAAVGQATGDALKDAGAKAVLVADPPDSEGLLAQPALAKVQDENIIIAKGNGGRELLADTLRERGANVEEVTLYRREPVLLLPETVLTWQDKGVDCIQVTSCSLLDALIATTPAHLLPWLQGLTLLLPSARVRQYAEQKGFSKLVLLKDASDEAVVHYLKESAQPMTDTQKMPKSPKEAAAPSEQPKVAKVTPPPRAVKANSAKLPMAVAVLALLLGAGALGLSGWQYYQQQLALAHKAPTVSPSQLNDAVSDLNAKLSALSSGQQQALGQQQNRLADIQGQIDKLWKSQQKTISWPREEAAMLVRMANRRLYLAQELNVAQALLKDADASLKKLPESTDVLAWRQAIAADLATLAAQPKIDRTELAMRLEALSKQVPELALNTVKLPKLADQEQDLSPTQDEGDWRNNLEKSLESFADKFIKIRKRQDGVKPLLGPSHEAYLREDLRLALSEAKLAMFAGDKGRYQASLRQVRDWVDSYGDANNDAVKAFVKALNALLDSPVSLSLPNKLDSLRMAEAAQ